MTSEEPKKVEVNKAEDFQLEEFKSLRREMEALQSEARLVAQIALAGGLAIYAWLAANEHEGLDVIGWWVPVFIPIFVIFHFIDHLDKVDRIAEYIRNHIENKYGFGWESFLVENRQEESKNLELSIISRILIFVSRRFKFVVDLDRMPLSPGSRAYFGFWFLLVLITLVVAILATIGWRGPIGACRSYGGF